MNRPMIFSLPPSPYTSAVARNVTPVSTAAWSTSRASRSLTSPQSAPSCHVPSPITETGRLVLPSTRCSTIGDPTGRTPAVLAGEDRDMKAALYENIGPARDVITLVDAPRAAAAP